MYSGFWGKAPSRRTFSWTLQGLTWALDEGKSLFFLSYAQKVGVRYPPLQKVPPVSYAYGQKYGPNPAQSDPSQPHPWMDPTHIQLCISLTDKPVILRQARVLPFLQQFFCTLFVERIRSESVAESQTFHHLPQYVIMLCTYKESRVIAVGVRANFFWGWAIFARKIFRQRPKKTAMLTCKITLLDSPHPVIISKNPWFRTLYLARQNEFRFIFV